MSPEEIDALAARLLVGQLTRLGEPHIDHARRVAAEVSTREGPLVVAAALLHDVLEKTSTTSDQLRTMLDDDELHDLVLILTQGDDEPDHTYLARCAADARSLLIKRFDLADKFTADTSGVPADVLERLQEQASERLALLERLARDAGHPPLEGDPPPGPPSRG